MQLELNLAKHQKAQTYLDNLNAKTEKLKIQFSSRQETKSDLSKNENKQFTQLATELESIQSENDKI